MSNTVIVPSGVPSGDVQEVPIPLDANHGRSGRPLNLAAGRRPGSRRSTARILFQAGPLDANRGPWNRSPDDRHRGRSGRPLNLAAGPLPAAPLELAHDSNLLTCATSEVEQLPDVAFAHGRRPGLLRSAPGPEPSTDSTGLQAGGVVGFDRHRITSTRGPGIERRQSRTGPMMPNTFHRAGPLDANHGPWNRGPDDRHRNRSGRPLNLAAGPLPAAPLELAHDSNLLTIRTCSRFELAHVRNFGS